jgi:diguanylate cyclase (GGDEF)-like protein
MNRRALHECADYLFEFMKRQGGSMVVMLADLDRFKHINDNYGHAKGDQVLQDFAGILKGSLRSSDVAGRFGGDEFVVLLPDTTLDEAELVAQRIQRRVRDYAAEAGLEFGTTLAMGEAPLQGRTLDELLQRVDSALYQSKGREDCPGIRKVEDAPEQATLQFGAK